MTGYQSKKKSRHADEITLDHLINLRTENERLREALQEIAAWKLSPDADTPIYMANIAEDALKEKE